jgi:hypothetical protein
VEANSTGGQGSRRAVAPSDDNDEGRSNYKPSRDAHVQEWPWFGKDFVVLKPNKT